jgi:hypothetical protein
MVLEQAIEEIASLIFCVDWEPSEDPMDNARCPNGDEYQVRTAFAAHDLFDDPEDALCRILISAVREDIRHARFWNKKKRLALYWRMLPSIDTRDNKMSQIWTRYVVSTEKIMED